MRKINLDWKGYYPLEERNIRDKVRDRSGIYKISIKQKNGSLKPILIEQAASLRVRLLEQLTSKEKSCVREQLGKGECSFKFAYLYTKEDLDAAVSALYTRYTPKCNDPAAVPQTEEVELNYN